MGVSQSNRRGARSPRTDGAPVVAPAAFDPSAHTVAEVVAYLAEHPDEADAVRAAEATGKARKGIIEGA